MPSKDTKMIEGPSLDNTEELLNWFKKNELTKNGKRRLFRIPVVIKFKDNFKLEIEECYVALSAKSIPHNPIKLELDDSGLGIDLITQIRNLCPQNEIYCALWLEGYWGRLVNLPDLDELESKERFPFAVLKVLGKVEQMDKNLKPAVEFSV